MNSFSKNFSNKLPGIFLNTFLLFFKKIKAFKLIPVFIFLIFVFNIRCGGFFSDDEESLIKNPFYYIFNKYYNEEEEEDAKERLEDLFDDKDYGNQARLNLGYIYQTEKDFQKAEELFKESYFKDENLALIYLFVLYENEKKDQYANLLNIASSRNPGFWVDYEKAVLSLKEKNTSEALKHLNSAVDKGFYAVNLFDVEDYFNLIKNKPEFKALYARALENSRKRKSLRDILNEEEVNANKNLPYTISPRLQRALYLEKKKRYSEAEDILFELIMENNSFREKSISLYLISRVKAKMGKRKFAKGYLQSFINHLNSNEPDSSGYKEIISQYYKDIINNDIYLKRYR